MYFSRKLPYVVPIAWFFLGYFLPAGDTAAQIVEDGTVMTRVTVLEDGNYSIEGGRQSGGNLFHSFQEFSVPEGRAAIFNYDPNVQNIINRVTGNGISRIDGTIEATIGNANVFLINPNGIVFGKNARLNVNGSFLATTADSIEFEDSNAFSASDPREPSLLSVTIPTGLRFGRNPGSIINRSGTLSHLDSDTGSESSGSLHVPPGKTLALVGGDIVFDGGRLSTPGATVELGAVGGESFVHLVPDSTGWRLGYEGVSSFRDIRLLSSASIETGNREDPLLDSGDIRIRGRSLTMTDKSLIFSTTFGERAGGDIAINTSDLVEINDGAQITAGSIPKNSPITGPGGTISIETGRLIVGRDSFIDSSSDGLGASGDLILSGRESIEIVDGGVVLTSGVGGGLAGKLTVTTRRLLLDTGGRLSGTTGGPADGGVALIRAGESVEVSGGSVLSFATYDRGNGGAVTIETGRLSVRDGGQISVSAESDATGRAGDLTITARDSISIDGNGLDITGTLVPSRLSSATFGEGDGGSLTIATGSLSVRDGGRISVSAEPDATGRAGRLSVNASSGAEISGIGSSLLATSSSLAPAGDLFVSTPFLTLREGAIVSAFSEAGRGGDIILQGLNTLTVDNATISAATESGIGGNLTIGAGRVNVIDGGAISASGSSGQGGNLRINANSLFLSRGAITAETGKSGTEGANIILDIPDSFRMENDSLISATATGFADGGNIEIRTPFFVVRPASGGNGSDILAKADEGNGGNIFIDASGIFGIEENRAIVGNGTNDIDASSRLGAPGRVELKASLDPNQGTVQLPETVIDPAALVARNSCRRGTESQFTITGKGGLPANASDDLGEMAIEIPLLEPVPTTAVKPAEEREMKTAFTAPSATLVPARGWIANDRGQIVLVSYTPLVTGVSRSPVSPSACSAP
jgi:filamentous hemagglutinin family protein